MKPILIALTLTLSSCVCISGPGKQFRCELRLEEIRLNELLPRWNFLRRRTPTIMETKTKMLTHKFKTGDKVVCVDGANQVGVDDTNRLVKGELYTVREPVDFDGEPYAVRLDETRLQEGHSGYGERAYNAKRFVLFLPNDQAHGAAVSGKTTKTH